jgi:hypothetical protein
MPILEWEVEERNEYYPSMTSWEANIGCPVQDDVRCPLAVLEICVVHLNKYSTP